MKFGLHFQLPCSGDQTPVQRYRDTLEQAAHAEALGFESVWPVEQHFNSDLSILPSPLLLLAALAERTRTLRLGIAIVLLPLSHPLRVAEEIATLDVISNGRVEFGIGRGAVPSHFRGFGVPQHEARERMLEELEVIVKAWTLPRVTHHGRFFDLDNIAVVPQPVQRPHPPIRVAANSADTFEMAGRMGLPIFAAAQVNPFHRIRELLPIYHAARAAAHHPAHGDGDVTLLTPLYVGPSAGEVRSDLDASIRHFLETVSALYATANPESGSARGQKAVERVRRLTYEHVAESMGVLETPERCVERLAGFRDEFRSDRVICWFNPGGLVPHARVMRSMELFAAKVMPQLARA